MTIKAMKCVFDILACLPTVRKHMRKGNDSDTHAHRSI